MPSQHGTVPRCRRPPAQLPAKPQPSTCREEATRMAHPGVGTAPGPRPCGSGKDGAPAGTGPACYSPAPSALGRAASRGAQDGVAGQRPSSGPSSPRRPRQGPSLSGPQWLQVFDGEPPAHGPSKASAGQAALWKWVALGKHGTQSLSWPRAGARTPGRLCPGQAGCSPPSCPAETRAQPAPCPPQDGRPRRSPQAS